MNTMDMVKKLFEPYLAGKVLNVGCGGNKVAGWDNLDMDERVHPDVLCRLGHQYIPAETDTYDAVVASHTMEHLSRDDIFFAMRELHRVLKPNGFFIGITPYGSFDAAWDNPHHQLAFTETTWSYFNKASYDVLGAGYQAWQGRYYSHWNQVSLGLVAFPEFQNDPELEWKKHHLRNVIQEMHVVLQAIKGEKDE